MDITSLTAELIRDEGMRLKPYRDSVGKLTIGVGHNLDDVPISQDAAVQILKDDIMTVMGQLNDKISWWATISEARQRVLANMCFNLGINGLLGFRHMLANGESGVFLDTDLLDSKWAGQVGERAVRLSQMWKNG